MKKKQETQSTKYPRISVRITPYLEKELRKLASSNRRKYTEFARMILEDHVHQMRKQEVAA